MRSPMVLMLVVVLVLAGCTAKPEPGPAAGSATTVGPDGGHFAFGDMALDIPAGTVDASTALTVGTPTVAAPGVAVPLNIAGALRLDISLGGQQPKRAIDLAWKLPATVRAEVANGKLAVLYTGGEDGSDSYVMVPSVVDPDGVLHASLTHLSWKWLSIFDPRNLVSAVAAVLDAGPVQRARPQNCPSELDVPGVGKVRLGGTGWSTGRSSGVHPCLRIHDGKPAIEVVNNAFVNWPVRATAGVTLDPQYSSVDEQAIADIASMMPGTKPGEVSMPRGASVMAYAPGSALPMTVGLQANPGPFLAETVWFAMNFLLTIYFGKDPSHGPELAKKMFDQVEVFRCVENYVRGQYARTQGDFWKAVALTTQALGGECIKQLTEAVMRLDKGPQYLWDIVWGRMSAVLSALFQGVPLVLSALEGAVRTIAGEIDITASVVSVPQAPAPQPQQPKPSSAPPPQQPPPPASQPVTHYDCPNDNSNRGHYVSSGRYWQNVFTAKGSIITGGVVWLGAATDGHDHRARVGIYAGSGIGSPLATVEIAVTGYDGESFTLSSPLRVTPGQSLYLTVVGIGDFTAYDNVSGCFIGRVDGRTS